MRTNTKHVFPRIDVFKRWIADPEYVHTGWTTGIVGIHDFLLRGLRFLRHSDRESVVNTWHSNNVNAIINRETKTIIIQHSYKWINELIGVIPKDYTIYITDEIFHNPNILINDLDKAKELAIKYWVKNYIKSKFKELFIFNYNGKKLLNTDIDNLYHHDRSDINNNPLNPNFSFIYYFVKDNKIYKKDYYKERIDSENYCIRDDRNHLRPGRQLIWYKMPSLKEFFQMKLFDADAILEMKIKYFYTEYCYGNTITYDWLKSHWFDLFTKSAINDMITKYNLPWNPDYAGYPHYLRDGIKNIVEHIRNNNHEH